MGLMYKEENSPCFQYQSNNNQEIEYIVRQKGSQFSLFNEINKIVFVVKGSISVSFGSHVKEHINTGYFFFVPAKCQYNSIVQEDTEAMVFQMNMDLHFCDYFSFEMLLNLEVVPKKTSKLTTLKINTFLERYIETLNHYLNDGLGCFYLLEIKQKELLFLLKTYYSKEELYHFFDPVLTSDIQFSSKVYEHCDNVKSSTELAAIMNYSLSGFEKRFKRVFGIPAYRWLKARKARSIFHEISCTKKTFAEIAFEYGFSSASYFNDFCKANFNRTPGEIRNQIVFPCIK